MQETLQKVDDLKFIRNRIIRKIKYPGINNQPKLIASETRS